MSRIGVPSSRFEVLEIQGEPFDALELHDREPQRIGAVRRTGGEHTALLGAARGEHLGAPALVQVKPKDDPDVIEPREIFEGVLVVLSFEELDRPLAPLDAYG